jgi:hypothetical protein
VGYCYPSGLEKTLCKWEIYVPLVAKGLNVTIVGIGKLSFNIATCRFVRLDAYFQAVTA